ncbi:MAG: purine-binding chemotaxis protein CheW [Lachnospiraceae bacterium]|nr:purine-binding chemotaxis protein CheW [Lachnospira sp.]MBR6697370.1 purine-binding chemotaxis protein CheW [Lachnospiraceae bacterium]
MEDNKFLLEDKESIDLQYIVIGIGNEQYGINIKYIDNIVRMQKITRVPMAQEYFKGVINLRGEIIPVMSIRRKLELDDDVITNKTRIIIAKVDNASIGFVVDEVKEVVTLDANSIERVATAEAASEITHCITSIGKKNGELISLLDLNLVAGEKEVS